MAETDTTSVLPELTTGLLGRVHARKIGPGAGAGGAVLQVLKLKVAADGKTRLILSDGKVMMPAVLGSDAGSAEALGLAEKCLIQLEEVAALSDAGKVYAELKKLEVLNNEVEERIGEPVPVASKRAESKESQYTTPSPAVKKTKPRTMGASSTPAGPSGVKRSLYNLRPIAALNPYDDNWVIKARVTHKTDIKTWSKNGRSGRVFNVHLLDANGDEIRGTFYNEAADKFFAMLEPKRVFTFSRGRLKIANKAYATLTNDYEITFSERSEIVAVEDDGDDQIGDVSYKFKKIADIAKCPVRSVLDVVGQVTSFGELRTIRSKSTGKELMVRKITIADDSDTAIDVACWGERKGFDDETLATKPVVVLTTCRVSDWDTRSLSTTASTTVIVDPTDVKEADIVRQHMRGAAGNVRTLSVRAQTKTRAPARRVAVNEIESMAENEPVYVKARANIIYVTNDFSKPPYYSACPSCNKKVTQVDAEWQCDSCNKSFPKCEHRYLLRLKIADETGSQWVNCFNTEGTKVLGMTANNLSEIKDESEFAAVFKAANFQELMFTLKVQLDSYQGQSRTRCVVLRAEPVEAEAECEYLVKQIEEYLKL